MMKKRSGLAWTPFRIVLIYAVIGGLWILFSDRLLSLLVPDRALFIQLSIAKGWLYVLASAWLLHALIRKSTEQIRRSSEALRESEERYRRIVETAQEGIWVLDEEARTTYVNQRLAEMFGYTVEEMLNRPVYDFVSPEQYPEVDRRLAERKQGISGKYDFLFKRKNGSDSWVIVSASPLPDDQGRFLGSIAMLTDITDRKRAEERERELEAHKREFYRRTIRAATQGKLEITDAERVAEIAGPAIQTWQILRGEDLGQIREAIQRFACEEGMDEDRVYDLVLATGEAITNAYKHADGGTVSLYRVRNGLLLVVSDRGPGIEALSLPEVALMKGYTTADSLGMGYKAMISVADRIYLATGPGGTTVGIEMCLHPMEQLVTPSLWPDTWNK